MIRARRRAGRGGITFSDGACVRDGMQLKFWAMFHEDESGGVGCREGGEGRAACAT